MVVYLFVLEPCIFVRTLFHLVTSNIFFGQSNIRSNIEATCYPTIVIMDRCYVLFQDVEEIVDKSDVFTAAYGSHESSANEEGARACELHA